MESKPVQKLLMGILFLGLFILVCRMFLPFFTVLLWSALLYVLFLPLYRKVTNRKPTDTDKSFRRRRNFFAGVFALLCMIAIVGPMIFLLIELIRQSGSLIHWAADFFDTHADIISFSPNSPLASFLRDVSGGSIDLSTFDLKAEVIKLIKGSSSRFFAYSTTIVKDVIGFIVSLCFMIFTLFFFFADGEYLADLLIQAVPIKREYMSHFINRFKETTRNLFSGYFLVALYQGCAAFALFTIFRVKGALLLAFLVMLCSFIPMIGAATIWLPVAILRMATGHMVSGIVLLILSAFFISTMDNFLRPLVLRDRMNIHPLLIFFSILGGVDVFGFNGLVLGPIIIMLFFTVLAVFKEIFQIEEGPKPDA